MNLFLLIFFSAFPFLNILDIPPPGTVHLKEDIYIDTEIITAEAWNEYILFKEQKSKKAISSDSIITLNKSNYINSDKFSNKLMKGISFIEAKEYCKWRTNAINNFLNNYSKKSTCKSKFYRKNYKKGIQVLYRLAKEDELLEATKKGIINNFNESECPLESEWNYSSTFRCVAVVIYNTEKQ